MARTFATTLWEVSIRCDYPHLMNLHINIEREIWCATEATTALHMAICKMARISPRLEREVFVEFQVYRLIPDKSNEANLVPEIDGPTLAGRTMWDELIRFTHDPKPLRILEWEACEKLRDHIAKHMHNARIGGLIHGVSTKRDLRDSLHVHSIASYSDAHCGRATYLSDRVSDAEVILFSERYIQAYIQSGGEMTTELAAASLAVQKALAAHHGAATMSYR